MVIGALSEPRTGDVLSINRFRVSFADIPFCDTVLSKEALCCSVDAAIGFEIPCPNNETATITATMTPTPIPIDGR